jgi:hypothetical protein
MVLRRQFATLASAAALGFLTGLPAFAAAPLKLDISLTHGSVREQQTQAQLEGLLSRYDLSKWIVTDKIAIDEEAIPHSHPVLTLHTRHLKDDELLLSTFVHEQTHWFISAHREDMAAAETELRRLFPRLPLNYPKGSDTQEANYEHLVIILIEWRADRELLGELKAREVMDFWAHDHYTALYRLVMERRAEIGKIAAMHRLLPA